MHQARLAVALLASALALSFLGACGDSGSDESEAGSISTETTTRAEAGGAAPGKGAGDPKQEGGDADAGEGTGEGASEGAGEDAPSVRDDRPTHSRAEVETPLQVSGGGSEQFLVKGGDNSVPEYGEEASESELREVAASVHGFYVARATGDWAGACSYLSQELQAKLEELSPKSSDCATFLAGFTTTDLPSGVWREITTVDAASLRHDGQQAFLIYRGAKGQVYTMPLHSEDGEWKLTALSGSARG